MSPIQNSLENQITNLKSHGGEICESGSFNVDGNSTIKLYV